MSFHLVVIDLKYEKQAALDCLIWSFEPDYRVSLASLSIAYTICKLYTSLFSLKMGFYCKISVNHSISDEPQTVKVLFEIYFTCLAFRYEHLTLRKRRFKIFLSAPFARCHSLSNQLWRQPRPYS